VLGLFVIRPILISTTRRAALPQPPQLLALPVAAEGSNSQALTGEIDDGNMPALSIATDATGAVLDPVARMRRLIEDRQAESIEILRGWMELEEEVR
jgi:flagellar M-ring protein FliF